MSRWFKFTAVMAVFAAVCAAAPAGAQQAVKPEIMLLVDTSGSMQKSIDSRLILNFPECATAVERPGDTPRGVYALSRMNLIKQALSGSPVSAPGDAEAACVYRVLETDANTAAALAQIWTDGLFNISDDILPAGKVVPVGDNNRVGLADFPMMCCARFSRGACVRWSICDETTPENRLTQDGVLQRYEEAIKFGLLTFDDNPQVGTDSFGSDHQNPGFRVEPAIMAGPPFLASLAPNPGGNQPAEAVPNLGAKGAAMDGVEDFGALVPGGFGLRNEGNDHHAGRVNETSGAVRRHNRYLKRRIRGLVARGFSPTSSLLHDLDLYYRATEEGGIYADEAYGCRPRSAVLFTDGGQSRYYASRACLENRVGCPESETYPYDDAVQYANALRERLPGLTIYVVGVGVPPHRVAWAQGIAGRPTQFFNTQSAAEVRRALSTIANRVIPGKRSRLRPLVIAPNRGDEVDETVRQLRITAFSEAVQDDRYGRIDSAAFGCPRVGAGEDLELLSDESMRYSDVLANQALRNTISEQPLGVGSFIALGSGEAMYNDNGRIGGVPGLDANQFRTMTSAPQPEDASPDPGDDVYHAVRGYFGGQGATRNERGERVALERQLGETVDGDLIAIGPPNLGVESTSYKTFKTDNADRPTIVAAGARDGMVHFFRAADGYELMSFVPRLSWADMAGGVDRPGSGALDADGPLASADMAECRSLGEGNADCPAEVGDLVFRTMVVGGLGRGGANIFGIELTDLTESFDADNDGRALATGDLSSWNVVNAPELDAGEDFDDQTMQSDRLGLAMSRPTLTYVRNGNEIQAAVIVGCGEDPDADRAIMAEPDAPGRCVLVLNAVTGELIRRFQDGEGVDPGAALDRPMVGAAVAFPNTGILSADRAYIGDRIGRIWRLDLRNSDPDRWSMGVAWPPEDVDEAETYLTGRPVVGRPSLSLGADGKLVVVFGTGDESVRPENRSHIISFTDDVVLGADDETLEFETRKNWVLPLRAGETASGPVVVRDEVAYFTSIQEVEGQACGVSQGRLYGVDYAKTQERFDTVDGRELNIIPALPTLRTTAGNQITDALAILLPAGRLAYGLAMITSPSCSEDETSTTEVVLNLAEGSGSAGAAGEAVFVERMRGQVAPGELAEDFLTQGRNDLAIKLQGRDAEGNLLGGKGAFAAPFPRRVLYWGSTFTR